MGEFSWMFADRANKENLRLNKAGWLLQPDGNHIYEECYDGYGEFDWENDVFELVVDWNRDVLNKDMLRKPVEKEWLSSPELHEVYFHWLKDYENGIQVLEKYRNRNVTEQEMKQFCKALGYGSSEGREWKRELGIAIAGTDEQNRRLPFPIKVCKRACDYDSVPASNHDPNQGEKPRRK